MPSHIFQCICVCVCVYVCVCVHLYTCTYACVHGAGGAPRQAQVLFARRGTGIPAHFCRQQSIHVAIPVTGMHSRRQECIPDDRNVFLSSPVFHARSPARGQHLGLPGGAAGAMDIHTQV